MQNPSSPPIVLASSSAYRRGLLDRFLSDFETVSPNVDESPLEGEAPRSLVARLARDKAETVSASFRDGLIIGEGFTTATDGNGTWGTFEIRGILDAETAGPGSVIVFDTSAVDGSQINVVEYPIILEGA